MKLIFDYDENITGHVPSESIDLDLPKHLMRSDLPLPNVNEVDVSGIIQTCHGKILA